jgi:hypothetical protein
MPFPPKRLSAPHPGRNPVTRASQILSQAGHPACRIGWTTRETFYRRAATSPGGDTPCSTPPSDPQPLIVAYGAQVRQDMPAGRWCLGKGRQVSQPATDGDRQLALPSRSQAGLEPVRLSLSVTAPGPTERSTPRASPPLCAGAASGWRRQRPVRNRRSGAPERSYLLAPCPLPEPAHFRTRALKDSRRLAIRLRPIGRAAQARGVRSRSPLQERVCVPVRRPRPGLPGAR